MALLTQDEARTLMQKVLSFSKADECQVSLNGTAGGNIRYALNSVSTSGSLNQMNLGIGSVFGRSSASPPSMNTMTLRWKRRCAARKTSHGWPRKTLSSCLF